MRGSLRHDAVRLAVFPAVCLLGVFGLFAVFGQLRFGKEPHSSTNDDVAVVECSADDTVMWAVHEPPVFHGLPR
jgi:phospholipid/cholesterol/gamma-HCH transport system substrate-binding protein